MLISAIGFTLLNTFIKYLNHFNVYQIVFFRSIGSLFFTVPFLLKNKIYSLGNKRKLLVLRSVFGFISMVLFFSSLKLISMGSAVSIRYIAPIFAIVFAVLILKEQIKKVQWLACVIAFLGVVIIKGFDIEMNVLGLLYALLSAFFAGIVYIIIRKIGDKDHPMVIVNYFMIISGIISGCLSLFYWKMPQLWEWFVLFSLGIFGYFGQYYMTKALQSSETNMVAPLKYVEVVFTMIIGVIWFKEIYNIYNLIGILLVVSGLIINVLSKQSK
nr:DMT family transporter [uncultured Lacinutrix sp.]